MKEKLFDDDKIKHFIVCFIATLFSVLFAFGLALGKEYGDKNAAGNHWCWLDLIADVLGIVTGGIVKFYILNVCGII